MPLNKALITLSIIVLTVVFAVLLYKILRAVSERLGFYNALKKFCAQNGGEIKKNNGLFKPVFAVYPGCDVEMTVGGTSYGL